MPGFQNPKRKPGGGGRWERVSTTLDTGERGVLETRFRPGPKVAPGLERRAGTKRGALVAWDRDS